MSVQTNLVLVALLVGIFVLNSLQAKAPPAMSGAKTNQLSIVVPTYDEVPNIRPLTERVFATTRKAGLEAELLFVDDESKGSAETVKIVESLQSEGFPVRIHARKKVEGSGLSSAVLLGFEKAKYNAMLCMDADLQHEPESVPTVAGPILNGEADFCVGSRNIGGGGIGFEWSIVRRIISQGATALAMLLSSSTDHMSGFFATTKDLVNRGKETCNPIGFKIGLELMVRGRAAKVVDAPITFQNREAGESKLSFKTNILYVQQLIALYYDVFGLHFPAAVLLLVALALSILHSLLMTCCSSAKSHGKKD